MSYKLTGTIKVIQEAQTFSSGFTKREFVVTVEEGKYPQDISLECIQDKVSLLDTVKEGDEVQVSFDIRGREYNGRYFNNLQAWRIKAGSAEAAAPPADDDVPLPTEPPADLDEMEDNIPF